MDDLTQFLPDSKFDIDAVGRAATAGWPAVAPVVPELLAWTVDSHWPVAEPMARFLFGLGDPILPEIESLLLGEDATAKWHVLSLIRRHMSRNAARGLRPVLVHLATGPSVAERSEAVDEIAGEMLDWLDEDRAAGSA